MAQPCLTAHWRFINLEGQRFGRWTVLEFAGRQKKKVMWFCRCDCGTISTCASAHLRNGLSRSCGCYKDEVIGSLNRTHGFSKTGTYRIWKAMRDRCNREGSIQYRDYGGRGIKVCERWNSYENFLADMGERPSRKHSIDRYPDIDGNYEPGNCRWATVTDQARHKRSSRMLEFRGETRCLAEWAEITGISEKVIGARLRVLNWTVEQALSMPARPFHRRS